MPNSRSLVDWLQASMRARPDHIAVEDAGGGALTYRELDTLSNRVRDRLHALGVRYQQLVAEG